MTQKITLLEAQKNVIEREYEFLNSTFESPDSDFSNLEALLIDAQQSLAEAQILAQQAEATSQVLTTSMNELQSFLEEQNDLYFSEIKAKQESLQQLIEATEVKENYSLEAVEKQIELNQIESQLQIILQQATDSGVQEAEYLLEVASNNNFATAAEIYYRDYRDLMTDTGGGCAGGIARPEDAILADYYHNEMLKYRDLQEQAQQQADYFAQIKVDAQEQITLIEQQQSIAQNEYQDIQFDLANAQGNINELQQELTLADILNH